MRAALDEGEGEAARMTSLVEDLLLARLDSGRPLRRRPVDLSRLLVEAVADAQGAAPGHRWRLELPAEPVELLVDEQRLHQVVTTLLTNAREYTPSGTVELRSAPGVTTLDDRLPRERPTGPSARQDRADLGEGRPAPRGDV